MSVETLSVSEKSRLMDIIFDVNHTKLSLSRRVRDTFAPSKFVAVVNELSILVKSLVETGEGIGLIGCFSSLDLLRSFGVSDAKVTFYSALCEVEQALKRGAVASEQLKYVAKDSTDTRKSAESSQSDLFRILSAVKVHAFQLILDSANAEEKASTILSRKQDYNDTILDQLDKTSKQLKDGLAELFSAYKNVREEERFSVLAENMAVLDSSLGHRHGISTPAVNVKLPSVPIFQGELFYALNNKSGSMMFYNTSAEPSKMWRAVTSLLDMARSQVLSKANQQALLQAINHETIPQLGLSAQLLGDLATHNPDVCAAILLKLPPASANSHIEKLLTSKLPLVAIDTVIMHASRILDQPTFKLFIETCLASLSASPLSSSEARDAVKSFALVLHQLVTKASKDNKQLFIPSSHKPILGQMFMSSGAPDVMSRWEEIEGM